jgi:hypothetical protein
MSVKKCSLDYAVEPINDLAELGIVYDGSPPMKRIVAVETDYCRLRVIHEDGENRLTNHDDYFIVELRSLKKDEKKKVENALNALADIHMLYIGAGFKREVFIVRLTKDIAYVISRDDNGSYQEQIPLNCLNYLFIKVMPYFL